MAYLGSGPAPKQTELDANTVETEDIQDGAVTAPKLAAGAAVPDQTGNSGKFLTTDGTNASWATISIPESFPSGTVMLFAQTTAPTGWTKDTTNYNNHALRVVTSTAGSGGSIDFTTAFASQAVNGSISSTTAGGTVGSTTLSSSQIPSHQHIGGVKRIHDADNGQYGTISNVGSVPFPVNRFTTNANYDLDYTSNEGGGGSHNHSFSGSSHDHTFTGTAINLAVKYLDVIVATKD
jgi:hypothetical protein